LADLYFFLDRHAREAVMANLKQVMLFKGRHPTTRELRLTTRTTFHYFGKYLVDYFRFSRLSEEDIRRLVVIEHPEYIEQARQDGKGVILVTAHLGNWELGGAVVAGMGYPLKVVALNQPSAKLNDFFQRHRRRRGMTVVPHGHAVKHLLVALKKNEFIALLADRDYSGRNDMASLCGAMACLPRGAVWLAEKTGAVILPGFMFRQEDDTFLLRLYPPIRPGSGMTPGELQRRICEALEDGIGAYPHQWFMYERVWDGLSYGTAATRERSA
jgi:KDO2-lipid IV(A) lauroyltransferase